VPKKYRSVFISDVHLGSRAAQADLLCEFLKNNTCQTLYLVGDIIDFWKLRQSVYWQQSHSNVIRRILTASKRGTSVKYIIGNHDETLRSWFSDIVLGNIEIANQFDHQLSNGKNLLVTHGDLFDGVVRNHKWLSILGDRAYTLLLWTNTWLNKFRSLFGQDYYSFSGFLKTNTKQAVAFITSFEKFLSDHAKEQGYAGVICGHIHTPTIKAEETFVYMNTGDFCETVSAIVEKFDNTFDLLIWDDIQKQMTVKSSWTP
jgi:UDP-2,3-diacylglucosamine pyrophosphatase LpxH